MKKIIYSLCVMFFCVSLFAATYTLENNKIQLSLSLKEDNNVFISSFYDKLTKTEYLKSPDAEKHLWYFIAKTDKDYAGRDILLYPTNASYVKIDKTKTSITLKWFNVKNNSMEEGFDVECSINITDNNSYWDMKISPNTKYGIWFVYYPYISNIYCENGDKFFIPSRGECFATEFDNPQGFNDPDGDYNKYVKQYTHSYAKYLQYASLSKDNSTLYLSPEDNSTTLKQIIFETFSPNTMDYSVRYQPENMVEAGYEYRQKNSFNLSIVQGDWYDAAKKYRKWAIDNKYGCFKNGPASKRSDLPEWWKNITHSVFFNMVDKEDNIKTLENIKYLSVPTIVHVYRYQKTPHDTKYPNILPVKDEFKEMYDRMRENPNIYIMPYTNGHLVDINHSEAYKKYGDNLLLTGETGNHFYEPWGTEDNAKNYFACIGSQNYYNSYLNEVCDIFRAYDFDALYVDQVGGSSTGKCMRDDHNHPKGGGVYYGREYNNLIKDMRNNLSEITNKNIPIITEDYGDVFAFDGWLRVSEQTVRSLDVNITNCIFSGYSLSMGDLNFGKDSNNGKAALNRIAIDLCKGYVLGWGLGVGNDFDNKELAQYFKSVCKAREFASEYFNLGEQIRNVNITSPIPTERLSWEYFDNRIDEIDFPIVRTCSFNYNNKTAIVFTNFSDENVKIEWNALAKDLNLKNKHSYKIAKIWPDKKLWKINAKNNNISSDFIINKKETVIFEIY